MVQTTFDRFAGVLVSAACADGKWDEAGRLAQDIVGAAGGLGLCAVTQAARQFAQKAREGENTHQLQDAAQAIVSEHLRARQTLTIGTADVEVARLLQVPLNSPVAEVRRVFTAADRSVIYLGEVTYRGDFVRIEMDLRP